MQKRNSRRTLIADATGTDFAEMNDYLYNAGHTPIPVWVFGNEYMAAGTPTEIQKLSQKLNIKFTLKSDPFIQKKAELSGWAVYSGIPV